MIKHQVRPGMTGWAQVNGYRGDTSIRKRIDCDLYYIENWTMGLDIKILFLTIFKGFVNKKRILIQVTVRSNEMGSTDPKRRQERRE